MIAINKAEKDAIIAKYPDTNIVRTVKQKSKRHKYYCEESRKVMALLNRLRNNKDVTYTREGGYTVRKKANRDSH